MRGFCVLLNLSDKAALRVKMAMSTCRFAVLAGLAAGLAQAAPAKAQNAARLFFEGDTVRGVPSTGPTGPICVLSNQFRRNEEISWRVRVLDGQTGKAVDDKGLKSLTVRLADGKTVALKYGAHPLVGPQTDHFWSGAWHVPADYPTGTFAYSVIATDNKGRTKSWRPFNVSASQLTIVADSQGGK